MKPYDDIELTEEEVKAAIYEAKKKKYFHERNKEYWAQWAAGVVKPYAKAHTKLS